MVTGARAEWDRLRRVAIHRPGIEMFFGLLEPYSSLYERAFSRFKARYEHENLEYTLKREFGVEVTLLKQSLLEAADHDPRIRMALMSLARESLEFSGDPRTAALAREDFERNADKLDSGHFFNILLLNPGIELAPGRSAGAIRLDITEHQPLSNLYFMRDQQVVTDRGIVISRMAKAQRARETDITRIFWDVTGEDMAGEIRAPATLEGGDFIPMGDFALIGVGDRTNIEGAAQLMSTGMGFSEVGVVHQPADPLFPGGQGDPMVNMHLDTFFNVAGDGLAIGAEFLLRRACVDVYHRNGSGQYQCGEGSCSLHDYLKGKGFEIIGITLLEQMAYASNILCVRDRTILSVESDHISGFVLSNLKQKADRDPSRYGSLLSRAEEDYRRLKFEGQFFPHKKEIYQHGIEAYPISLQNLTGGYGGAHCMTCTLERG